MINFTISMQIQKELKDFENSKVNLSNVKNSDSLRYLSKKNTTSMYSQMETINLIDLYYNSKFENGDTDALGQQKMFVNIGKFRADVSAKQIDIDVSNFRFLPDDYSDPWTAIFLQKDFKEWTKDTYFGDLVNTCVEAFPKYGTIVLKEVGKDVEYVPLQNLSNEQTADSLDTASYVIEKHPAMRLYEIQAMKKWKTEGLQMRFDETMDVYERYGHVPVSWLKKINGQTAQDGDGDKSVDAVVIVGKIKQEGKKEAWHIFFASEISKRPYREAHWSRQHGRWLGVGVIEDLFENQKAKNIIVNLIRRSLHWSSKRVFQSANSDVAEKNFVRDIPDGSVLDVGPNGAISEINLSSKTNADFSSFLAEWERNSDQKSFTYEVATGEALPSGTPFRLGVVLSNATNSFFSFKREKLGIFFKKVILDFLVPQFLKDMGDQKRVIALFSGENGFNILKDAARKLVMTETARVALLNGNPIDESILSKVTEEDISALFVELPPSYYKEAKYKFDFTVTGEEVDLPAKLETLKTLYQVMSQTQNPMAEKVLERILALSGESLASFGSAKEAMPTGAPQMPQIPQSNAQQPATI